MGNLKKILFLFNTSERKYSIFLLIMIFFMGVLDMLGVASIMPFIAVISNPEIIESNFFLNILFENSKNFGVDNQQEFTFFLGLLIFIFLIITMIFKAITTYLQIRFVLITEYKLSKRLLERYLEQPYSWFLHKNSSELGKNILSQIRELSVGGILPLLNVISQTIIVIALLSLLIFLNPKIAITIFLILSTSYLIIYLMIKKFVKSIGQERIKADNLRFKNITEAFGAIKEIKVANIEKFYGELFAEPALIYAKNDSSSRILGLLPRFIIEAIGFGGMLLVILFLMSQSGNFTSSLPFISVYAFSGYKILPALQKIYISIIQLRYSSAAIHQIYEDFKILKIQNSNEVLDKIKFQKSIILQDISFRYPKNSLDTLSNINIEINSGSSIGLVGKTGSGKSTIVDIILFLLEPQNGRLSVDGKRITKKNSRSWQSLIGYVPQQIYLIDESIAANIAFGSKSEEIDFKKVEYVSKLAGLHSFIKDLPQQYFTKVGEKGVRLSGGQRQRIGIARAIYNNPKIIIFDEATSALDNQTESKVINSLKKLKNINVTSIFIAHRLNTIKECDVLYFIDNGKVIDKGTFNELYNRNKHFKNLANSEH